MICLGVNTYKARLDEKDLISKRSKLGSGVSKIIHYCWFGGKKLDKLAKKCIESWKKYLPDYEIIEWNETNFDVNQYGFTRLMYENKKWAFVADYVRTKVLIEYGGIYFDTDLEITSDVSKYLGASSVFGVEDSKCVNVAMCIINGRNNNCLERLLEKYNSMDETCMHYLYKIAISVLMTEILKEHGYRKEFCEEIQVLNNGQIIIYPREYFYPLSYDYRNNKFTRNTCMIHHFNASWISRRAKIKIYLIRHKLSVVADILNFIYMPIRGIKDRKLLKSKLKS